MKRSILSALLVVVMLSTLGVSCGGGLPVEMPNIPMLPGMKLSDREMILRVLDDVHRNMERRKTKRVLAHVSENYQDEDGRDYNAIVEYLNAIFSRYRDITITRAEPRIRIQDSTARVVETFGTRAIPFDAAEDPPINIQGDVQVILEKQGDDWKIIAWDNVRS